MDFDPLAIQTLGASLKTVVDIAKGIREAKSTAETEIKVTDLQAALLGAQSLALSATNAQFELHNKVRELEEQLKAANDWGEQESRYSLVCPWGNSAQVYALKRASTSEGEAPHFLCSNCFHNKKRVILNPMNRDGWILLACPSCKATIETGYRGIGSPKYAEECENRG